MSPAITWPSNTVTIIDDIRDAIGREVTFYVVASSYECPVCGLDPVTNTAIDSFCPTCSGAGIIVIFSGVPINAHVTWGYSEHLGWVQGGQIDEGDCRVQIKYTIANESTVDSAKWVVVDGREMQFKGGGRKILRGVKPINRILVDLIEKERE